VTAAPIDAAPAFGQGVRTSVHRAAVMGVLLSGWAAWVEVRGPSPLLWVVGAALALTLLVGVPRLSLTLLLVTISCDQVLTFRASASVNLRLAHLCALALVLRLLAARCWTRGAWRVPLKPLQPLLAYLLLAGAGAFFSENLPKTTGYLLWATADVFALFAVLVDLARTEAGFRTVRRAWAAGAAIAAGFGMLQLVLGFAHLPVPLAAQHLGAFPRINGFDYEPAYYALYLESVAAVYLGQWVRGGRAARWAGVFGLALLVPAALSMSRSGWLGLGLLFGYLAWNGLRRARPRDLAWAVGALGLLACGGAAVLPPRFLAHAPKMAAMALNPHEASSTHPRLESLVQAAQIFAQHPVMGVGLGGYGGYVAAHPELGFVHGAIDPSTWVTTNLWLETAAELGVLGVGTLLWFLGSLLRSLWRARRVAPVHELGWVEGLMLSVGLVFFVLYQFNQTLWRLDVWVLLAMAWAAVVRVRQAQVLSKDRSPPSSQRWVPQAPLQTGGDFSTGLQVLSKNRSPPSSQRWVPQAPLQTGGDFSTGLQREVAT